MVPLLTEVGIRFTPPPPPPPRAAQPCDSKEDVHVALQTSATVAAVCKVVGGRTGLAPPL